MDNKFIIIAIFIILVITYIGYLNYGVGTTITSYNIRTGSMNNPEKTFSLTNNSRVPGTIKIMTYNIRYGKGLDDNLNLDRIIEIINNSNAQIIALNEVEKKMPRSQFQNQVEIIAERLDMNYIFGPNIQTGIGGYGNVILTDFPIKKAKNHLLPYKNIGSEPRGLLEGIIKLPTNEKIHVFNTHLTLNIEERQQQLSWIETYLENLELPFILMGDFNEELNSIAGLKPLVNTKTFPADNPNYGIDLIFSNHNNLKTVESYEINTQASDHLPVFLKLEFNNHHRELLGSSYNNS